MNIKAILIATILEPDTTPRLRAPGEDRTKAFDAGFACAVNCIRIAGYPDLADDLGALHAATVK